MRQSSRHSKQMHTQYCANANSRSAGIFSIFCVLEAFLAWRSLNSALPAYSLNTLFVDVILIAVSVRLIMIFRCLSERFVICLLALRGILGLVGVALPKLGASGSYASRHILFILWVLAFIISLRMFIRASRLRGGQCGRAKTKTGLAVLIAIIGTALFFGALLYFIPLR